MTDALKYITRIEPTGSRYICNPPPQDTDQDFIVLVQENSLEDFIGALEGDGWELGGSVLYVAEEDVLAYSAVGYGFNSYTKEMECGSLYNFIITCSEKFFDKFMQATEEAKQRNLLKKEERIALFQRVLYGNEHYLDEYAQMMEEF